MAPNRFKAPLSCAERGLEGGVLGRPREFDCGDLRRVGIASRGLAFEAMAPTFCPRPGSSST